MTETANEIIAKIDNAEGFDKLESRMDSDFDMWKLKNESSGISYDHATKVLKGIRDTDIHFTSNNPRSFADHVCARLSQADMQIIIRMAEKEGKDRRDDIAKLERLMAFAFDKADERLTTMLMLPPLRDFLIWCGAIRGRMAARVLVYKDGDNLIFDFLPLDPRFIRYAINSKGIQWISYKTFRSAEAIRNEYGKEPKQKQNNEVTDYWEFVKEGNVRNSVICEKEFLRDKKKYKLNRAPVIYLTVVGQPPVGDSSGVDMTMSGESIYAPVRDIYKFENDMISMWASHANLLFKQPMINYFQEGGVQLNTNAYMADAVINLPADKNKLDVSPMKEISPTLINLVGYIGALRQRATLADIEFGELRNYPLSGTAINELQQSRDKVFGPLIKTLNTCYSSICNMVEEQIKEGGIEVDVKTELDHKFFQVKVKPTDLAEAHVIRVEFAARTPWNQLDSYQIADMAKRLGLPDEFIWEYILKLPDPKGIVDQVAIEMAEHSPNLIRLRAIKQMLIIGREDEAKSLMEELYKEWQEQEMAVQQPQQQQLPQGQPQ